MRAILNSVLHPTDFSDESKVAFYHALKAALVAETKLTLLNVSTHATSSWADFPGIWATLEKWGMLEPDSPKSAVKNLGIEAKKAIALEADPVRAVVRFKPSIRPT